MIEQSQAQHVNRSAVLVAVAMLIISSAMGCRPGGGDPAAADGAKERALLMLTAESPGDVDQEADDANMPQTTPAPPGGLQGEVAPQGADAILTQVAALNLDPDAAAPLLTQAAEDADMAALPEGVSLPDGDAQARATRSAAERDAGIANVDLLVLAQAPLATFTPAPVAPSLQGQLVYLRNGIFYTTSADGKESSRLELDDPSMPSVWAPPDDPGRAWLSPDGERLGFLAGIDAGLWVMDIDGSNNRQVFGNLLPDERHDVAIDGASQSVKFQPGLDYTLVRTPGASQAFSVLVDNNQYHIAGEGRVRIVHAAAGHASTNVLVRVDGRQTVAGLGYGRGTPEERLDDGSFALMIEDGKGGTLGSFPAVPVGEREVKTVFVWGTGQLQATQVTYPSGTRPGSGSARVRVFNASSEPLDLRIDGDTTPIQGVAPGTISPYMDVAAVLSEDARKDFQVSIYGLRPGEDPITWSPTSDRFAFVAGPEGVMDLYATTLTGQVQRLTDDALRETNPRWSPDGRRLAWISVDEGFGGVQVFVLPDLRSSPVPIDIGPIQQLTGQDGTLRVSFPHGLDWADENTIYLLPTSAGTSLGIWTYDVAAEQLSAVWDQPAPGSAFSSTTGQWVLHDEEVGRISVVGLDGRERTLVESNGYYPSWAPGGEKILYGEGAPMSSDGWRLRAVEASGSGDTVLTEALPLMQESPPVPGPNAKRFWLNDNTVVFTRVGRDYGKKDRTGMTGNVDAGPDIENLYRVSLNGSGGVSQLTDLMSVFYMNQVTPAPSGNTIAFIAFAYNSRGQQLFTAPSTGGKPVKIDAPVRWFAWIK